MLLDVISDRRSACGLVSSHRLRPLWSVLGGERFPFAHLNLEHVAIAHLSLVCLLDCHVLFDEFRAWLKRSSHFHCVSFQHYWRLQMLLLVWSWRMLHCLHHDIGWGDLHAARITTFLTSCWPSVLLTSGYQLDMHQSFLHSPTLFLQHALECYLNEEIETGPLIQCTLVILSHFCCFFYAVCNLCISSSCSSHGPAGACSTISSQIPS